ncbi:MAG: dTDP-4-dehydrorhamnose reductase [Succinivibrio sp.]
MSTILLTGALGQLGREVTDRLLELGFKVIACSHSDLDITNEEEIRSVFEEVDFDLCINTASFSDVDLAEDEKQECYAVNALGPKLLSRASYKKGTPLLHISSDYVYDTDIGRKHLESDAVKTNCEYGRTKLLGEGFIVESSCKYVILRTSWLFGRYGSNFVKAIANLAKTRDEIKVVADEFGNPTPARALADAICELVTRILAGNFSSYGIYNYCCKESILRSDYAREIIKKAFELGLLQNGPRVLDISSKEYGAKASRPKDSRMNTTLFESTFGIRIPSWRDYIEETLRG